MRERYSKSWGDFGKRVMEETGKKKKNAVVSWIFIDVVFIAVIVFLLTKYLTTAKASATSQMEDKFINYATIWSQQVKTEIKECEEYGNLLAALSTDAGYSFGSLEHLRLAATIVDSTDVSHILFCDSEGVIIDETGEKPDFDPASKFGSNVGNSTRYYAFQDNGIDGKSAIVVCVPTGENSEYSAIFVNLDGLTSVLSTSGYEDVSFLCLASRDGIYLAGFDKFKDADSTFIKNSNVITAIYQGAKSKEEYNSFKLRLGTGIGAALESSFNGESRLIAANLVGVNDWYLIFGLRQAYADRLVVTNFSDAKATTFRFAAVVIIFSIFVVVTMIFTSLKNKERGRALEDKADTDLLTDLNNKAATERKIQEYIESNPNGRGMMFILDIDNFKKINDTMGHAFGDTLLKTLGKEIKAEFRLSDIIGRTGGDEFMVFLKDVNDDVIIEREANRISKFFHDFKAGGDYVKYSATASIGAAIFPDDAKTFKELYVAADQALYRAKKRGKNQLVFYNEEEHGKQ